MSGEAVAVALAGLEERAERLAEGLVSLRAAIAELARRAGLDGEGTAPAKAAASTATLRPRSRAEHIRRLYLDGARPAEISARLGITVSNANTIVSELRGRGALPPVGSPEDGAIKLRQQAARMAGGLDAGQGRGAQAPAPGPARPRRPARSDAELVAEAIASGSVRITKCPPAYLAPVQGAEPLGPLPHCAVVPDPFRNPPRRRCVCGQYFVAWQARLRHCESCRAGGVAVGGH